MQATYVAANQFTVVGDRTAEFITGRRIKADCGVDGTKYCTVLSSTFGATTAVTTKESELTDNLVTVLYGIVESGIYGSLPDHSHDESEGSGGSDLGTSGDVTFGQSIIVDEIRSNTGGLILGGYAPTFTDIDFTDPAWTETDPGDDITVAAAKVSWAALPRNLDSYVYYDYTADYFDGDFVHKFEAELTSADDDGVVYIWVLANDIDDIKGLVDGDKSHLKVYFFRTGASYRIYFIEQDGAVQHLGSPGYLTITVNTTYYFTVVRDESIGTHGTIYLYVYSDSDRTMLVGKVELALHTSKKDFRYLYACNTRNDADAATITGYTQNLSISATSLREQRGAQVQDDGTIKTPGIQGYPGDGVRIGYRDPIFTDIDFTDPAWTEADPNTLITVAADKVSWAALSRNEDAWVYYDYGVDYFDGDFRHEFECELTAADDGAVVYCWALANAIDNFRDLDVDGGSFLGIFLYRTGAAYWIYMIECDSGDIYQAGVVIATGTHYYVTVVRDESIGTYGTIYMYVYSDVNKTILVGKGALLLHTDKKDFRYLYACVSYNDTNIAELTGWVQNLRLSADPFGIEKGIYVHDDGIVDMEMQSGCSAYQTTAQDLVSGAITIIVFNSIYYDHQNEFNSVIGRFTAIKPGEYAVHFGGHLSETLAATKIYYIYIKKNGSYYTAVRSAAAETISPGLSISQIIHLDAGDYIDCAINQAAGVNRLTHLSYTYFSIGKIS